MEIKGFDELRRKLDSISKRVENLSESEEQSVSAEKLLSEKFMRENTQFESSSAFFEAVGISSPDEYKDFPQAQLDEFVKNHTRFETWKDMLTEAAGKYMTRQIFED